jgi:hypothetical protein
MRWAILLGFLFATPFTVQKSVSSAAPAPNAPIWSKKGTSFPIGCANDLSPCRPLKISSPDGESAVLVTYETSPKYPDIEAVSLKVTTRGKFVGSVSAILDVDDEITWSPDSKCFFINANWNGYADAILAVHCLNYPNLGPGHITLQVERDMVRSFPPCRATYTPDNCAKMAADPDSYRGVVGIDWIDGSSEIAVMADVPCSSSMGGIMCQVLGYEIAVPSGKILRRMEPKEFAHRWQHSMAWKFSIPDPPEYKKN